MDTCRSCGAHLGADAQWCWQCYRPVEQPLPTPRAEAPTAGPLALGGARADDPLPLPRYSRWKAGATTFGPVGKILITAAVVGFGCLLFLAFRIVEGPMVIADVGGYAILAGLLLRQVWRRVPIS